MRPGKRRPRIPRSRLVIANARWRAPGQGMGPVFAVCAPRSALVLESASNRASSRRSGQPLGIRRRRPVGSIWTSAQNESARRTLARWFAAPPPTIPSSANDARRYPYTSLRRPLARVPRGRGSPISDSPKPGKWSSALRGACMSRFGSREAGWLLGQSRTAAGSNWRQTG